MPTEVIIVPVIFGVFALVLKWWMEYRLKTKLIEKGMVDERVKILGSNTMGKFTSSSLKWGIVFVLVGGAMLVIRMLPVYIEGETILGVMLLAAGVGLLLFYFIDGIMRKNSPFPPANNENEPINRDDVPQ
ncbi:MAG: hypothetical protein KAR42_10510 [candidate division Zixibacteria bacterium]|nr:hypothetical protein [candidate division Zixibacteria bacterium]